jgi:type IV pilus assembly protein PilX
MRTLTISRAATGNARARSMTHNSSCASRFNQRGVVLFVALIVLVAMSLAGIGMMRSVDSGNEIAGNLAFRQSAIHAQESALEEAIRTIRLGALNGAAISTGTMPGYSSTYQAIDNVTQHSWANSVDLGTDANTGNRVSILIDRLCDADENCAMTEGFAEQAIGGSKSGVTQQKVVLPHYRVVARVTNVKNMVTYVEGKFY